MNTASRLRACLVFSLVSFGGGALFGEAAAEPPDRAAQLQAELAQAKAEIEQLRKALAQSQKDVDELRDRLVTRQQNLAVATKELEKLKGELRSASEALRKLQDSDPELFLPPLPPRRPEPRRPEKAIQAKVTGVDKALGLVIINKGQRDGVQKDDRFVVSSGDTFIGAIIVDEVFPDMAAAHYDKSSKGHIEVGDDANLRPPQKESPTPKTGAEAMVKIVALGDSTTNCVGKAGVTEETAWRTLLAADLAKRLKRPVEVVNAGVDADTAPLALKRLERDVLDHKPDWVVILLGTNDAGFFRPPNGVADTPRVAIEEFEKAMREIIGRTRKAGAGVVLATSLPMSGHYGLRNLPAYKQNGLNYLVKQYAEVTRRLAKELGLPLAEVHEAFEKHAERDALIPDGIHPNAAGQRLIADALLPVLERALAGAVPPK
jgi:lysophospholipase L1-like esterase